MRTALIHALLCLAVFASLPALAADGGSGFPETPSQAPPPPPEPPKPGHQPKLTPHEAVLSDVITAGDTARDFVELQYEKNHTWPTTFDAAAAGMHHLPTSIESITLGNKGTIQLKFRPKVPAIGGKFVTLTPQLSDDGKNVTGWSCAAPDIAAKDSPCPSAH